MQQKIIDVTPSRREAVGQYLPYDQELFASVVIQCPTQCFEPLRFTRLYIGTVKTGQFSFYEGNPLDEHRNRAPMNPHEPPGDGQQRDRRPVADCEECGITVRMTRETAATALFRLVEELTGEPTRRLLQPSAAGLQRPLEALVS